MIFRLLGPLAVAVLCGVTLWQTIRPSMPKLLYNPSPSAPIGWYRLRPDQDFARGDLVAAFAPEEAQKLAIERHYLPPNIPLIKTVWAIAGEEICHLNGLVQVTNRPSLVVLARDSQGRPLPSGEGCHTIAKDEVFLVSTDVQTSFDSRYFGPVPVSDVLGPVQYLGRFQRRAERRKAGRG